MKILVFGSINIDKIYDMPKFVEKGETIHANSMNIQLGGKGYNQAVAFANAECDVYLAGCIGKKDIKILDEIKAKNINVDNVVLTYEETGHAIIQICDSNNSIIVNGGSNFCITKKMIDDVLKKFDKEDILVIQNEISNIKYLINSAIDKGMKIVFNPSPFEKELLQLQLNSISMLFVNEIELNDIIGNKDLGIEEKITLIANKMPNTKIIITLGDKGAYYKYKDELCYSSAVKTTVIDTTAAGDTFEGFFISSLIKGYSIKESMEIACKASSISVSKLGASNSIPTWNDLE